MAGLGTIVNVAGILAGCGVGLLLKGGLPKRLQDTISSAVGLCVVEVSCLRFVMAWVRMTALIGYRKKKHTWGHIERQKIQIK